MAKESEVQPHHIVMNPKLFKAAISGDKKILYKLLQQEGSPLVALVEEIAITVPESDATQEDTSCLLGVTPDGNTALHIVAGRGHLELANEIYHRERSLLMAPNKRSDTPLHCAARVGDDKMVSLIIQFAMEDEIGVSTVLRATNRDNSNALHEAAKYDHVRVAEILMERDAQLASMVNDAGMSPLCLAITTGSLNTAKALLRSSSWEEASPTPYVGPERQTALHVAVLISPEITKDLLDRKPMLAKGVDSFGRIPLHHAALNGHHDTVKLLLKRDPTTAYESDAEGLFPIHLAASMGNVLIVDQILEQCPDAHELLDRTGRNFLHVAFCCEKLDMVKKIISKRRDLRKLLNNQDSMGNTPLHTAVENKDQGSVNFLLRNKTVCVNVINHDGFTPLDLALDNLDPGLSSGSNATYCILSCLAFTKALLAPPSLRAFRNAVSSSDEGKTKPSSIDEVKEKSTSEEGKTKPSSIDEAKKKSTSNEDKTKPSSIEEVKEKSTSGEDKKIPSGDDKVEKQSPSDEKKEMKKSESELLKKELDVPKSSVIAAVLIATVTFAAGFTVPGGYIADDHPNRGTAVLAKEYAFKVFLVSDAFAFVCSILATFWLIDAGTSAADKRTRMRELVFAAWSLLMAFNGMSTAFAMGIYATLLHSYNIISFLVCIIALGTPILGHIVSEYNLYSFRNTIAIRQGYRHWIWPTTIYPAVENYLRPVLLTRGIILQCLLSILGSYAIFFLSLMLWAAKN